MSTCPHGRGDDQYCRMCSGEPWTSVKEIPEGAVPVMNPQGTGETDIGSACGSNFSEKAMTTPISPGRPEDEDYATCADCGGDLEAVRPGKHQHPGNYGAVCLELRETRRELSQLREENGRLREVLEELTDLMQGVIDGDYKPDSFTLQPARAALTAIREQK